MCVCMCVCVCLWCEQNGGASDTDEASKLQNCYQRQCESDRLPCLWQYVLEMGTSKPGSVVHEIKWMNESWK